jgi:chemotaxis protein histidine kinase CheA
MDEELQQRLLAVFREEAVENLDELRILVQRVRAATPGEVPLLAKAAMRIAHNIKGASSSVGLDAVATLAHALEDALQALADRRSHNAEEIARAASLAITAMEQLAEGGTDAAEPLVERLRHFAGLPGGAVSAAPATASSSPPRRVVGLTEGPPAPAPPGGAPVEGTRLVALRVETTRLDALARHAGELVSLQAELASKQARMEAFQSEMVDTVAELAPNLRPRFADLLNGADALGRAERDALLRSNRLAAELGEAIRRMRMVPLSALFAAFRRCVAETAQTTGKEVELLLEAANAEIDKHVLDQLREPLLHLLRNAVDHGIEALASRARAGKRPQGTIAVRAQVVATSMLLTIDDDGQGIDVAKLKRAALKRGRTSQDRLDRMSHDEAVELVFQTGLSTADRVSPVSGRGIGLDVVRRAVVSLGGTVTVATPGPLGGASFRLSVPLHVLSSRVLLVRTGQTTCALPITGIERTLRIDPKKLAFADGDRVLARDGENPLRVRDLGALVGAARARGAAGGALETDAVVVHERGLRVAVTVDEVLGDQELVVKKLPWHLRSVRGVVGATALPDGRVAIVLDIGHLVRGRELASEGPEIDRAQAVKRVLVADDSVSARMLARNVLASMGYDVTLATDGVQAWAALREATFDLVVSDVQMPGMDGLELTKRIRADARLKQLPIVLVTSSAAPEQVQAGLAAGADEYVVKGPLQQQKLLEAVGRHA